MQVKVMTLFIGLALVLSLVQNKTDQTGKASYYADKFTGKPTASGELYDPKKLTAAHRSLPFGTEVKVTNIKNGKSVNVTINDRGPFIKGRIIDLSKAAANRIDLIQVGVAEVTVHILDKKQ